MCGCIEKMPVVDRSDCTQLNISQDATFSYSTGEGLTVSLSDDVSVAFQACQGAKNNDLEAYYDVLVSEGKATAAEKAAFSTHIIGEGNCPAKISEFMSSKGYIKA